MLICGHGVSVKTQIGNFVDKDNFVSNEKDNKIKLKYSDTNIHNLFNRRVNE